MSTVIEQPEATEVLQPAPRVKPRVYRNPNAMDPVEWMAMVTEHRRQMFERVGFLPDSALEVAEDRLNHE